jgi:hypothetical protein
MRGQKERLSGSFFGDPFHFIENSAWSDDSHPILRRAFPFPHPSLCRFFRNRFIREDTDPDSAGAFDESGHGDSSGFDLPSAQPAAFCGLESEVSKVERISS